MFYSIIFLSDFATTGTKIVFTERKESWTSRWKIPVFMAEAISKLGKLELVNWKIGNLSCLTETLCPDHRYYFLKLTRRAIHQAKWFVIYRVVFIVNTFKLHDSFLFWTENPPIILTYVDWLMSIIFSILRVLKYKLIKPTKFFICTSIVGLYHY